MEAEELLEFLIDNVPNFVEPELIDEEGECYHYTGNWELIQVDEAFKGAPINNDLDQTQQALVSPPATDENGVVFAYDNLSDAKDEGIGLDIVKITYRKAIRALHESEDSLDESFINATKGTSLEGFLDMNGAPPTLLILVADIIRFELVNI